MEKQREKSFLKLPDCWCRACDICLDFEARADRMGAEAKKQREKAEAEAKEKWEQTKAKKAEKAKAEDCWCGVCQRCVDFEASMVAF